MVGRNTQHGNNKGDHVTILSTVG